MQLRIYVVTYNVGTVFPTENLENLLSLNNDSNIPPPDLYVIGLQEVRSQPHDFIIEELVGLGEAWTETFQQTLRPKNYVLFQTVRLQGLVLLTFCLRRHLMNIRDLEANYTRTGLMGYWGNKGAVTIRFNYSGCSVCFINAHLSAHENKVQSRINDFKMIVEDQQFESTRDILSHNYVFWLGDLNFRLSKECTKSFKEVEALILDDRLNLLVQYDELKQVMLAKKAFHQLTEQFPTFAPTFKFKAGTSNYNSKRRPAWTDRILYKVAPKNGVKSYEARHIEGSYTAHTQYIASDHKPVTSEFLIKIPSGVKVDSVSNGRSGLLNTDAVIFEKIDFLWNDEENTFTFTIKPNVIDVKTAKHDWIAILPVNFVNYNQYITYEYVHNLRLTNTRNAKNQLSYECTFPNLPFTKITSNNLCLVYFQRSQWHLSDNIKGISNSFYVKTRQEILYTNAFI